MFFCSCCATDQGETVSTYSFDPYSEDKANALHSEECFHVFLRESTPLGLSLDCLDGLTALVNHVRSGGTVEAHNRAAQSSGRVSEQVRPGDYIIEVNGIRQSSKMVDALERGGGLDMKVVRPRQFLVSLTEGKEGVHEPDVEPPCAPAKRTEADFWSQFTGSSCGMTVWGMEVSWAASGKTLLVNKVGAGPIRDWNVAHPDRAIQRLDRVIAVNGVRAANGVETLLEQLQARNSELLISRPGYRDEQASHSVFSLCGRDRDHEAQAKGLNKVVELWDGVEDKNFERRTSQKIEVCGLSSHEVEGHPTETDLLSRAAGRASFNSARTTPRPSESGVGLSARRPSNGYTPGTPGRLSQTSGTPGTPGRHTGRRLSQASDGQVTPGRLSQMSGNLTPGTPGRLSRLSQGSEMLPARKRASENYIEETQSEGQVTVTSGTGTIFSVMEEPLPKVGETLYFTAGRQKLDNGDKLTFGQKGKVISIVARKPKASQARPKEHQFVEMLMEGNRQPVCIRRNELSRNQPQMPPGWALGDVVLYRGPERQVSASDKLIPGLRGEVVGRAARRGDSKDEHRLSVHFQGHKLNTPIIASAVRRA
jgi:hypothetical protein